MFLKIKCCDFSGILIEGNKERFPFEWKKRFSRWETKWNRLFHGKIFEKKGIPSEAILFSRFHLNYRKITLPFTLSH